MYSSVTLTRNTALNLGLWLGARHFWWVLFYRSDVFLTKKMSLDTVTLCTWRVLLCHWHDHMFSHIMIGCPLTVPLDQIIKMFADIRKYSIELSLNSLPPQLIHWFDQYNVKKNPKKQRKQAGWRIVSSYNRDGWNLRWNKLKALFGSITSVEQHLPSILSECWICT